MKFITLILFAAILIAAASARAGMPALPEIPVALPDAVREPLIARSQPLALQKLELIEEGASINRQCSRVEQSSAQHQSCLARVGEFNAKVEALRVAMDKMADEIDAAIDRAEEDRVITAMNAIAKRPEWSSVDRTRLDNALRSLSRKGEPVSDNQINGIWSNMLIRGNDELLAREASGGTDPGFPGAGLQKGGSHDCAVFALANAAGLPYGVVAARAAELISQGEWRKPAERQNPRMAIEQRGLNGGELVILAEAFGQAEVVKNSEFVKTLKEGRPIMVNVVPEGGKGGHEIVLTKTFKHGGETWYEMMDSNQGPLRRLYIGKEDLNLILQENGVAFRPEPNTTPKLLRPGWEL